MNSELRKCSPFDRDSSYRILAIDPSTTTMGVAIGSIDAGSEELTLHWNETVTGKSVIGNYEYLTDLYGSRFARLEGFKDYIIRLLNDWQIHSVVCEGNYLKHHPTAFAALTECVYMIRTAVLSYSTSIPVIIPDPSSVKVAVGVKGNVSGKEPIGEALKALPINFKQPQNINVVDHNALDAIAILYWHYQKYLN